MLPVIRLEKARQDLINIWRHIALDDPQSADDVLDAIDAKCQQLSRHPQLGPAREDIRPGLRYLVIGSYLALYKVDEDAVRIVRVLHGHRDLGGLFVE
ncbi:type II toxin-antitoxin system RelE/ParE family toxin [Pseudodesulfovibrio sp.]|uniref:type II toxin-antitoxin system RelE/ParE family toxin n=1 Tax=Pseudodesulfovibrio sp. TaxID=2035812 RepID=UPI0026252E62|nr:type II toxin-antitoxin system RelE/ParE family toxin [Pseudodesulfovibrio sp.]MDD3311525.1 type II toxin-antitoxin system RelE/ParE family toxin [Pseudodesulfovibrio sp.]